MSDIILLIDDDIDEITIFSEAVSLTGRQFEYTYAQDAQLGIKMLEQYTPSYIFIDMNMPRIDGLACVARIRKLARFDDTPIIVYSAGMDEVLFKKALAVGASDCIRKEDSITRQAASIAEVFAHF